MDIFTPEKRSEIMSRIRSTGTKAEERLFRVVREALGHRWRIDQHPKDILGTPDIFVPSLSLVFFLDGCFFHGCPIHGHIPKSNTDYWKRKIARNIRRDQKYRRALRGQGFAVWRFWEHELKATQLQHTIQRVSVAIERQKRKQV
jgi:DNA mismatch endonuclease (patch repair protein)